MEIRRRSYGLEPIGATRISTVTFGVYSRRALPDKETLNVRSCIAVLLLCLFNSPARAENCIASVYSIGDRSQRGTQTASGIPLDDNAMTAAHKSLKFGSKVKVINKSNLVFDADSVCSLDCNNKVRVAASAATSAPVQSTQPVPPRSTTSRPLHSLPRRKGRGRLQHKGRSPTAETATRKRAIGRRGGFCRHTLVCAFAGNFRMARGGHPSNMGHDACYSACRAPRHASNSCQT